MYTRLGSGYRARTSMCTHRNVAENTERERERRDEEDDFRAEESRYGVAHVGRERVHRGVVRPTLKHSLNSTRAAESIREPSPAQSLSLAPCGPRANHPSSSFSSLDLRPFSNDRLLPPSFDHSCYTSSSPSLLRLPLILTRPTWSREPLKKRPVPSREFLPCREITR